MRSVFILALLALLWFPAVVRAQSYTQVSATVMDKAGAVYSNGSWQANLDISGVPIGQPVTFQRTGSFQTAYGGQLDSFGRFSVTLPANDAVSPVNTTQWDFRFCQRYSTQTQSPAPACFGLTLAITGVSMDITSQVQAASASLGPITPGLIGGSLLPTLTNTYNLGSPTATWANVYAAHATLANPLPVSSGGTGSSTAGSNIPSTLPVPVSEGGTGTTTPALVAGAGIAITGSWPDQTVSNTGSGANLTLSNLTNPTALNVPSLDFAGAAGLTAEGSNNPVTLTPSGSANVIIGANGLQFPDSTVQTTAAGTNSALIAAKVDLGVQNAAISATTFYTRASEGLYRATLWMGKDTSGGWTAGTITLNVLSTWYGVQSTQSTANLSYSYATGTQERNTAVFESDAGQPIQYSVTFTGVTGTPAYEVHIRLEYMQ